MLRLATDATGIKTSNRGEWIRVKWNVKRGFFKLHILVDLDTRRILAFDLTDMGGGDAAMLPGLLSKILKEYTGEGIPLSEPTFDMIMGAESKKASRQADPGQTLMDRWLDTDAEDPQPIEVAVSEEEMCEITERVNAKLCLIRHRLERMGVHIEMRADGAYDTKLIFSLLAKLGIIPVIKIRIDARPRAGGVDRARVLAVLEQLGGRGGCTNHTLNRMMKDERRANQKEWKKDARYGLRWLVEIVISSFKRVFGESVRALKPHTAFIEIATKVAAYNCWLDIGEQAVAAIRGSDTRTYPFDGGGIMVAA